MGHIVGIIPARGGSVRVPLKNVKLLNGKPLIAYTIESAISSKVCDRVIVSTDHDEIARISRECGAEVPFKRPKKLAEDVDTELVLQHAVQYLEEREHYSVEAIVLLQPTSPLRKSETIVRCVNKFREIKGCDSVITVNNIEGHRPEWMLYLDKENKVIPYNTPFKEDGKPVIRLVARQRFPTLYRQNGVVYVASRDLLMKKGQILGVNTYAIEIGEEEAADIDTPVDFIVVESIMRLRAQTGESDAQGRGSPLQGNAIKFIAYDFDGVMTDNTVALGKDGEHTVFVNRSDGLAISRIKALGIEQEIISTEDSEIARGRAKKLGIHCIYGVADKRMVLEERLKQKGIDRKNAAYVGNDVNDLEVMKFVGYPIAPADACAEVRKVAKVVTQAQGGRGVIREVLDIILKSKLK